MVEIIIPVLSIARGGTVISVEVMVRRSGDGLVSSVIRGSGSGSVIGGASVQSLGGDLVHGSGGGSVIRGSGSRGVMGGVVAVRS